MLHEIRLVSRGGAVAPGVLRVFAQGACRAGLTSLYADRRQTLVGLFPDRRNASRFLDACPSGSASQGAGRWVMSSLYAAHVPGTSWVTESVLLDVLDAVSGGEGPDVLVTDPLRDTFPYLPAGITVEATEMRDLWRVFGRGQSGIVSTTEIGGLFQDSGAFMPHAASENRESLVTLRESVTTLRRRLVLEGFTEGSEDFLHLGLFRADHMYPLVLLDELAALCRESGVGRILFSPYHSIMIRGIPLSRKERWEEFIKRHSINVQHSQIELGWSVSRQHEGCRKRLVRYLREQDCGISGFDCSFEAELPAQREVLIAVSGARPWPRYTLAPYGRRDPVSTFSLRKIAKAIGAVRWDSRFERPHSGVSGLMSVRKDVPADASLSDNMSCRHCLTVYDTSAGDLFSSTPPGTSFAALPDTFACPVCGAPKEAFTPAGA